MSENNVVTIPVSHQKLTLAILSSLILIVTSFWLMTYSSPTPRTGPMAFLGSWPSAAIGFVGFVTFAVFAVLNAIKLFSAKPGLILDSDGMTDNSSAVSAGRIRWTEIKAIEQHQMFGQKFLAIHVLDPQPYLHNTPRAKRRVQEMNMKITGSPITIAAAALNVNFAELETLIRRYHAQYGKT